MARSRTAASGSAGSGTASRDTADQGSASQKDMTDIGDIADNNRPNTADAENERLVEIEMQGDGPLVVREKVHAAIPMGIDQALFEMELVGHDFFLFTDAASGLPSVVYRRRGYQYGVIRLMDERAPIGVGADHRQAGAQQRLKSELTFLVTPHGWVGIPDSACRFRQLKPPRRSKAGTCNPSLSRREFWHGHRRVWVWRAGGIAGPVR